MPDDLGFLAGFLHPADKPVYRAWRKLLDAPARTRAQQHARDQHMRLLTLQLTCVSERLAPRLEPPFDAPPGEAALRPLVPRDFERYRTLLLRVQLSQQQRREGSESFRQIMARYNSARKPANKGAAQRPQRLQRTRPVEPPEPPAEAPGLALTGEVIAPAAEHFEFDPGACYTSQQFRGERRAMASFRYSGFVAEPELAEPEPAPGLFDGDYGELAAPADAHVDEMEYTYFSSTVKRLRGAGVGDGPAVGECAGPGSSR